MNVIRRLPEHRCRTVDFTVRNPARLIPLSVAVTAVLAVATACGLPTKTSSPASCEGKKTLTASGSSAQVEAMTQFAAAYAGACRGRTLDYTSSGSASGRSDFVQGHTDFGGTDSPLSAVGGEGGTARARCGGNEVWNLPMVFGAVAITYNVPEIDSLILDAPTAAKIFNGSVTTWDAPEIAALNTGEPLPSEPIVVIFRSDESGTTETFQRYLEAASGPAWRRGGGETFNGIRDGGAKGVKGNEGAWAAIKGTAGSITYSAWPFAKTYGLSIARLITPAGSEPVELSLDSVDTAIAGVESAGDGNDLVLDTEAIYRPTRVGAYPIVLTSYEVVCSRYPDPQTSAAVRSFLTIALGPGQDRLAESGYAPVPASIRDRLGTAVSAIGVAGR